MRISVLAALMAASALVPGAAFAQRGDDDYGNRQARQAARADARGQGAIAQSQAEPQAQVQARPDRSYREDGERRGGLQRGENFRGGVQQLNPPQLAQPTYVDRGEQRGDGRAGYRGNVGTDVRVERGDSRGQVAIGGQLDVRQGRDDRRGNDWRGDGNRGSAWNGNAGRGDNRGGNWNRGGRDYGNRTAWNRNWRQDNRYDWNRRRQYDRNAYHLPRYYAPSGWNYGYRRFDIGFTLSAILFNRNYWIDDAGYYGLPDAYGEYRWVRYYNDALLVDIYTGEVVDTVYGSFW